jgi:hypothetical protein
MLARCQIQCPDVLAAHGWQHRVVICFIQPRGQPVGNVLLQLKDVDRMIIVSMLEPDHATSHSSPDG